MIFLIFTLLFFFRGHGDGAPENDYVLVTGQLRRTATVGGQLRRVVTVESTR